MYNLQSFKETGVAWPLSVDNIDQNKTNLEKEYFNFQALASKILRQKISLKPNLLSTFFDSFLDHPSILPRVKKIIGDNIYVWSSVFFAKAPGEGKIVSYHQDNPYWQLSNDKVVTVWLALTSSDEFSGALELVPGSHKLGLINKIDVKSARDSYLKGEKTTVEKDLLSFNQNLDDYVRINKPRFVNLKPGQFSIHHLNTVHGSGINRSENYRIGFAIRYVSSDTRHLEVKKDSAIHICGKKNNFYTEENRPKNDFDKDSIKQYQQAMNSTGAFGNKKY